MKGITHFAIGVATASCFPSAVTAAAEGDPLYFMLGGACGLLPDTLDFKVVRFFVRADVTVTPDPLNPDYQQVAQAIAHACARCLARQRPVRVRLNTIQLRADRWLSYRVTFEVARRRVRVVPGPVVDTGGHTLANQPATPARTGVADLPCDITLDYEATTRIDRFDGPVFDMAPLGSSRVRPRFIPWHRTWSHSLVTALLLGLAVAVAWGPVAGLVGGSAFAAHALADQLGFMGSCLLFPFRRSRFHGAQRLHSTDAMPNLTAAWCACLVTFWNLAHEPGSASLAWNPIRLLCFGLLLPWGIRVLAGKWRQRARRGLFPMENSPF